MHWFDSCLKHRERPQIWLHSALWLTIENGWFRCGDRLIRVRFCAASEPRVMREYVREEAHDMFHDHMFAHTFHDVFEY